MKSLAQGMPAAIKPLAIKQILGHLCKYRDSGWRLFAEIVALISHSVISAALSTLQQSVRLFNTRFISTLWVKGILKRFLYLGLLLSCFAGLASANPKVTILLSGNNPAYEKLASTLATSLQKETTSLIEITSHTVQNPEKSLPESIKAADVLVTLGPSATSFALNAPTKAKIISTFVTQNAMSKLIAQHKSADPNTNNRLIGAVYLDQPAKRLLQLALLINPELKQIGMLTGALSRSRTPEFRQQAASLSIAIDTQSLEPHDNPIKILEPIMANSQAYIVLPDTADFNRNTARWIIYLSYRYAVPVIGYSNRYIDAGALASIFSTPEQMGKQAAEQVIAHLKEPSKTPRFEHPNYYLVRLNEKVQRSLGYTQLDETVLSHQLNALEKAWIKSSRQEGLEHNE